MSKNVSFAPLNDVVFMGDKPGGAPFQRKATPFPTKDDLAPRDRIGSDDSTATNLLFEDPHSNPFVDSLHYSNSGMMLSIGVNEKRLRQDDAENSDPQQQLMPPPPTKKFAAGTEEQKPSLEDGAQDDDGVDEDSPASDGDGGSSNDDDENEAALEEWNSVTEQLLANEDPSSPYRQRLEVFLKSLQKRQDEQEKLHQLYEETKKAFEENLDKTIQLIVPVHSEIQDSLHSLAQDLVDHFVGNHELRQDVIATLEATQALWQEQYEAFYARITQRTPVLDGPGSEPQAVTADDAEATTEEEDDAAATTKESTSNDNDSAVDDDASQDEEGKDDSVPEPDWDAIIELDPSSRDVIDAFRKGRDHWRAALEDFEKAVDSIYEELKENNASILQAIEQAYVQIVEELDELQFDIQHHIVANFQKRDELKHTVAEAKKTQLSMFQRLMQSVTGASSSTATDSAAATTTSNAPLQHSHQGGTTTTCGGAFSFGNPFRGSKRK